MTALSVTINRIASDGTMTTLTCCSYISQVAQLNSTILLQAVANQPNVVYNWTRDGVFYSNLQLIGIDTSTPFISAFQVTVSNGTSNASCCIVIVNLTAGALPLTINPLSSNFLLTTAYRCCNSATTNNMRAIESGSSICVPSPCLEKNMLSAMGQDGQPPYNFVWTLPNNQTISSQTVNINQEGTYTVVINDTTVPIPTQIVNTLTVNIIYPKTQVRLCLNDHTEELRNNDCQKVFDVPCPNIRFKFDYAVSDYPCPATKYQIYVNDKLYCQNDFVKLSESAASTQYCTYNLCGTQCATIKLVIASCCCHVLLFTTQFTITNQPDITIIKEVRQTTTTCQCHQCTTKDITS